MKADAAFEGGGIRGIAYAGAIEVFERAGVQWQSVAGTSAGAITAALLAFGLRSRDILGVLRSTDFRTFLDPRPLRRLWDLWWNFGACRGDAFEEWLRSLIGDVTLAKVPNLVVVTVDLAEQRILELSAKTHPDLEVARAVRMSMSIPGLFRAVRWRDGNVDRYCVDGGVCLNYPIETFDVRATPRWPTFGFTLAEAAAPPARIAHARHALARLVGVMRAAPARRLDEHNAFRSVVIDDGGVDWLAFHLDDIAQQRLIANGRTAAEAFLYRWEAGGGFGGYVERYRA